MNSTSQRVFILFCLLLLLLLPSAAFAEASLLRQEQDAQNAADAALHSLSDAHLMQEYNDPGHLVSLAPYTVLSHASSGLGSEPNSPYTLKYLLFGDVKKEIVRRGAPMVTPLTDFLTAALPKPRRLAPTPPSSGVGCWYDTETIALLAEIRNPCSAQALLFVLTGDGKKPAFEHGYAAEAALETLTYCCFYKGGYNLNTVSEGLSVPRLEATRIFPANFSKDSDFEEVAVWYRQWLAGEGKDARQWLPLARRRARTLLATDDPVFINDAALFLTRPDGGTGKMRHDDAPEQTRRRLAEIASQVRQEGTEVIHDNVTRPVYSYKGQPVPEEVGDLSRFLKDFDRPAKQFPLCFSLTHQYLVNIR